MHRIALTLVLGTLTLNAHAQEAIAPLCEDGLADTQAQLDDTLDALLGFSDTLPTGSLDSRADCETQLDQAVTDLDVAHTDLHIEADALDAATAPIDDGEIQAREVCLEWCPVDGCGVCIRWGGMDGKGSDAATEELVIVVESFTP